MVFGSPTTMDDILSTIFQDVCPLGGGRKEYKCQKNVNSPLNKFMPCPSVTSVLELAAHRRTMEMSWNVTQVNFLYVTVNTTIKVF